MAAYVRDVTQWTARHFDIRTFMLLICVFAAVLAVLPIPVMIWMGRRMWNRQWLVAPRWPAYIAFVAVALVWLYRTYDFVMVVT
jgi:hypothetical protein